MAIAEYPKAIKPSPQLPAAVETFVETMKSFQRDLLQDDPDEAFPKRMFHYEITLATGTEFGDIIIDTRVENPLGVQRFNLPQLGLSAGVFDTNLKFHPVLNNQVRGIAQLLDNNSVEVDCKKLPDTDVLRNDWWNDWKNNIEGHYYRSSIYPMAAATLAEYIPKNQPTVIADIFGGDGEFLQNMAPYVEINQAEFHVIERNRSSIARGMSQLSDVDVAFHQQDIVTSANPFAQMIKRPNIVSAIGALCQSVITREQAVQVATKVFDQLSPGGIFLVTGYSPVLLNSDHFSSIGFSVEQKAIAKHIPDCPIPTQMYVLRKP